MNKLDIVKTAVNLVVGAGTTKIASDIIKSNTSPENVADQAAILAASFVIGSMAADATQKYTSAKIDSCVTWWKKNVTEKSA